MLVEILVITGITATYMYNKNSKVIFKRQVNKMLDSNNCFWNKQGQRVKLIKIKDNVITLDIRNVISLEDFYKKEDYISTSLCSNINIEPKGKYVDIILRNKPIQQKDFIPVDTREYELYLGNKENGNPVLVNLNSFPHMLIGGDTGTGKSIFLMMALANLVSQHNNIDLYMFQIRKSDLIVFKDCKQVKYIARDSQQAHSLLKHLNNICIERDKLLEKHIDKGILNIKDYNKYFKNKQLNYIYITLDEFSFFVPSPGDTAQEKRIKKEILSYIKMLVNVGRSTGMFIITSLQKPTSSSIPVDIKSQLTTRVCFRIGDNATSQVVLNNSNATLLKPRQAIIKMSDETKVIIPNVDYKRVHEAIRGKIEDNKQYITLKTKEEVKKVNNKGIIKKKVNIEEL